MTTLAVRAAYSPPRPPTQYDAGWWATQLGLLARAVPPIATRSVKAATTLLATDTTIFCDATAAAFTVTLLPPEQVQYMTVTIKKTDASANGVTIGGTTDGVLNRVLAAQYKAFTIQSDGIAWNILASV